MKNPILLVCLSWFGASAWAAPEVNQLSGGGAHTCALLDGGDVLKCWGENRYGQLGTEDTQARGDDPNEMGAALLPVNLGTGRIIQVVTGGDFTCALKESGAAFCFGQNSNGQLGVGHLNHVGDEPDEMGVNLAPVQLGARTVSELVAGDQHACALTDTHQVLCWGDNQYGQLGAGDSNDRGGDPAELGEALAPVNLPSVGKVVQVAVGGMHSCALTDQNAVYCWGDNRFGQLGIANAGAAVGDGPEEMGDALTAALLPTGDIVEVTAGFVQTCARYRSGDVTCWGYNEDGRLGLGDLISRGLDADQMGGALPAVALGSRQVAEKLSCGYRNCCARMINQATKCWGLNFYGELGTNDRLPRGGSPAEMGETLPFVELGTLEVVREVAVGELHTCALLSGHRIKCWGLNHAGQLGQGDDVNRGGTPNTMGTNLLEVEL